MGTRGALCKKQEKNKIRDSRSNQKVIGFIHHSSSCSDADRAFATVNKIAEEEIKDCLENLSLHAILMYFPIH